MYWRLLKDISEHEALLEYGRLHDGLTDMIEGGRLNEADIPDDYQWLVETLERLAAHWLLVGGEEEEDEKA